VETFNSEAEFTYEPEFLDPRRTLMCDLKATKQQPQKPNNPMVGWVAFKQRQAAISGAGPIGEAHFVGLHYPYRRYTSSTPGVPEAEAEVWLCVCGLIVPNAWIVEGGAVDVAETTDDPRVVPVTRAQEEAFYAYPGHRNCTTRTFSRPGTTAQAFLVSRRHGDDHVIHVWCTVCGDVDATPMKVASSPRRFYFPSFTLEVAILSVSTAREVVIDHEDGCQLLRRYNRATFPNMPEWKSPGVLLAEFLASVDISKLRSDIPAR
jgi:hypothetical protein